MLKYRRERADGCQEKAIHEFFTQEDFLRLNCKEANIHPSHRINPY
jgi:hypothetical protein